MSGKGHKGVRLLREHRREFDGRTPCSPISRDSEGDKEHIGDVYWAGGDIYPAHVGSLGDVLDRVEAAAEKLASGCKFYWDDEDEVDAESVWLSHGHGHFRSDDEREAELARMDAEDSGDFDDEGDGESARQRGAEERAADHWRTV